MKVKIIEWLIYPETTDRHASKIVRTVQNTEDSDELEKKLNLIDKEIQTEAFGYTPKVGCFFNIHKIQLSLLLYYSAHK